MRTILALTLSLVLCGCAHADVWKITTTASPVVWKITTTAKPAQVGKSCQCSAQCTCGCNDGKSCQCGNALPVRGGVESSCPDGSCATGR